RGTEPCSVVPFAIGLVRVTVAGAGAGAGAGATTLVGSEVAVTCFLLEVAVTRILEPTSAAATEYVCAVAPARLAHALPLTSHLVHWYVNDVGPALHPETSAVSVAPTWAVPVTAGFQEPAPLAPVVIARTTSATSKRLRCGRRMLPSGSALRPRQPSLG